jgi:hypothetical protein
VRLHTVPTDPSNNIPLLDQINQQSEPVATFQLTAPDPEPPDVVSVIGDPGVIHCVLSVEIDRLACAVWAETDPKAMAAASPSMSRYFFIE